MAVLCSTDYPVNPEDHNLTHKVFQRLVRYQLAKQYCDAQGQYDGPRYLPASEKITLFYKKHLLS